MSTYKIYFYKVNKESDDISDWSKSSECTYDLTQGSSRTMTEKINEKDINVNYLLKDISFHKEVYQPGYVEFVVQITLTSDDSTFVWTRFTKENGLKDCPLIDLFLDSDKIADSYWVFSTKYRKVSNYDRKQTTTIYFATCKAYSLDKFLTVDKYNRAFTGRKLVGGVVNINNEDPNDDSVTPKKGIVHATFDEVQTNAFKSYRSFIDQTNTDGVVANLNHLLNADSKEAVLPYNVQYNESFYDFLVRVCNRNGEFLYCKDNKLHIGLTVDDKTAIPLSGFSGVESDEQYLDLKNEANYIERNSLNTYESNDKTIATTRSVYPPEYLEKISKADFTSWSDFVYWPSTVFSTLKAAAESQAVFDIILNAGLEVGLTNLMAMGDKKDVEGDYHDEHFPDNVADYQPFTNANLNVDADFYTNVLRGEKDSEQGQVIVIYDTCQNFEIGDKVKLEDNTYVVYRIKGSSVEVMKNGTFHNEQSYELQLLPLIGDKVYPLPLYDLRFRQSAPQRALVVSNFDPAKLGRVRVKYFWQKDDEDASPWIRVSAPGASKGSGLMLFQKEGDEVLIDYDEGNIEHPYVAGALYSHENSLSRASQPHLHGEVNSLTSANGHHISFSDSGGGNFIKELVPVWSILAQFGVVPDPSLPNTESLGGGFEIADKNGFYSITGSTHERNISISSPLGDIELDAFSGITINAPLGDVEIVGKNVKIEARNNLELVSGTNIDNPYFYKGDNADKETLWKYQGKAFFTTFADNVLDLLGLDFGLYRTLLEVVFRPIGGTMLIKSNRFMRLEAGEGETSIFRQSEPSRGSKVRSFFTKTSAAVTNNSDTRVSDKVRDVKTNCQNFNTLINLVSENNGALVQSIKEYRAEISHLDGPNDYSRSQEEKRVVEELFTSLDRNVHYNRIDAWAQTIQPKETRQVVSNLKKLSGDILALRAQIDSFKSGLVEWENYQDFIDGIVEEIKNATISLLGKADINDSYESPNLKDKINVREYRQLLIKNVASVLNEQGTIYKENGITIKTEGFLDRELDEFTLDWLKSILGQTEEEKEEKFVDWLKELSNFDGFIDDNVWGANEKGSILLSSKQGKSYQISENGTIVVSANLLTDSIAETMSSNKDL